MIKLEDFKKLINEENLKNMNNLKMPFEWAYNEFLEIIDTEAVLTSEEINVEVNNIINDYMNWMLKSDFSKYELEDAD